jgi:hypothetical protein
VLHEVTDSAVVDIPNRLPRLLAYSVKGNSLKAVFELFEIMANSMHPGSEFFGSEIQILFFLFAARFFLVLLVRWS